MFSAVIWAVFSMTWIIKTIFHLSLYNWYFFSFILQYQYRDQMNIFVLSSQSQCVIKTDKLIVSKLCHYSGLAETQLVASSNLSIWQIFPQNVYFHFFLANSLATCQSVNNISHLTVREKCCRSKKRVDPKDITHWRHMTAFWRVNNEVHYPHAIDYAHIWPTHKSAIYIFWCKLHWYELTYI